MNRGNFLDLSNAYLAVLSQIFSSFHFQPIHLCTAVSDGANCFKFIAQTSPLKLTLPSKAHILGYGNQMTRTDMLCRGDMGQFLTLEIEKQPLSYQDNYTKTKKPHDDWLVVPTVLHFYTLSETITTTVCIQAHKNKVSWVLLMPNAFTIYIHNKHSAIQKTPQKLGVGITYPQQVFNFNSNVDSKLSQNRLVQNY